jgi:hypothetical protein
MSTTLKKQSMVLDAHEHVGAARARCDRLCRNEQSEEPSAAVIRTL